MLCSLSYSKFRCIHAFAQSKTLIKQPQGLSMSVFGNVSKHKKLHFSLVKKISWVRIFLAF